ncbi:MAG: cobalamin-dependent protein, partial [Planctomycetota bacterium]
FVEKLVEFDPHVVGFRIEGGQLDQVKRYVRAVRRVSSAEIVLGGPTATSHPLDVLEETGADYVFAGEAEEPFSQFLRMAWERNSKDRQPEIPGLAYRYGDRAYLNTLPRDGYGQSVLDADRASCRTSQMPRDTRNCGWLAAERSEAPERMDWGTASLCPRHPTAQIEGHGVLRNLRHLVRPVAGAAVITGNRLDWSLLNGFDRAELDSLFFTGGRGCPGTCTFCANLHGQEVRVKSARQLLEEIEAADAMVAAGKIRVTRWKLFAHVDDPRLKPREVVWAAVYDEDFFLHRKRAVEFFRLWHQSPLGERYRLSLQTNPCSMLASGGRVHAELLEWIDRVKPMVQLGAESFNPELLARWHKRHNVEQLNTVLTALDGTRQDYTVFQLLTDFDTTPEELVETLRLLITNAYKHRRMRIAASPFTIPLYDSDTRRGLEFRGLLTADRVRRFTDYERPQPGWMDPLAAELADLADAELQWTLHPEKRDAALFSAMEVVLERIREEKERLKRTPASANRQRLQLRHLHDQARRAMDQIKDARFQGIGPIEH